MIPSCSRVGLSCKRYIHPQVQNSQPGSSIQKVLDTARNNLKEGKFVETVKYLEQHNLQSNHTFSKNNEFQFLLMKAVMEANKMGKYVFATNNIFFGESSEKIRILTSHSTYDKFDPGYSSDEFVDSMAAYLKNTFDLRWNSEANERTFYEGMSHFARGEWKAAKKILKKISGLPEADLKLGHLMLLQGKPEAAFEYYRKAEKGILSSSLNDNSSLIHAPLGQAINYELKIGRGFAYIQQGDWAKGCKIIREAYEADRTKTANNLIGWLIYQAPYLYFSAPYLAKSRPLKFAESAVFQNIFHEKNRLDTLVDRQSAEKDLELVKALLLGIAEHVDNPELRMAFTGEVLSKYLPFQTFKGEVILEIPSMKNRKTNSYRLRPASIDQDMPITFLVPLQEKSDHPPILIFRGTNLDFFKPNAWKSIVFNFDPAGPVFDLFHKSTKKLEDLLQDKNFGQGCAQVMGYSQGGALAAMTVAKFKNHVCKDPSFPSLTFHAPAVRYDKTPGLNLRQYVIKGDIISRVGHTWLGEVYQIEYNRMQTFLNPHFTITLAQPGWRCQKIDDVQDELSPSRNVLTPLASSTIFQSLYTQLDTGTLGTIGKLVNALLSRSGIEYDLLLKAASTVLPIIIPETLSTQKKTNNYLQNLLPSFLKSTKE